MIYTDPTKTHLNRKLVTAPAPAEPLCCCLTYIGDNPPCPIAEHNIAAPKTDAQIVRAAVDACRKQPTHEGTKYSNEFKGVL